MTLIPDFLVVDRYPSIQLERAHDVEAGTQVVICWNGTRAPNGDGISGGEAEIDFDNPIAGPMTMWRGGHSHWLGGGFPGNEFPHFGAADSELGFCVGPFCAGPFCVGTDVMAWTFPFPLRDGDYRFAVLLAEPRGNVMSRGGAEVGTMRVEALPRPASGLFTRAESGFLNAIFDPSPEFAATA